MKHTTKKMKLFLYICLGLIILNACTFEEEIIKQNGYQEKMKLESKKFSELLKLPAFSNAYKRVINKKVILSNDLAARTALEDQYGFTIVENKDVKIITDVDGSIYYNMLVERAVKERLKFENLVIKVKDNEVGAVILKYELNEKATYNEVHDTYFVDIKETKAEPLEVDGKMIFIYFSNDCIITTTIMCNQDPNGGFGVAHIADQNCVNHNVDDQFLFAVNESFCASNGGGTPVGTGTSTGNDGFGTSGAGGNNPATNTNNNDNPPPSGNNPDEIPLTNNTPPIKNVVIVPDEEVEEPKTPCSTLKKAFEISLNNSNFNNMINTAANQDFKGEAGMIFTVGTNGSYSSNSITPANTNTSIGFTINIPIGTLPNGSIVYAAAHTHPIDHGGSPIFSLADLFSLAQLYKNVPPHLRSEVFFILSIPNGATYAITVNNYNSLMLFINNFGTNEPSLAKINDQDVKWKKKNAIFDRKCTPNVLPGDDDYVNKTEHLFLNLIKDKGVDLYEKDSNGWNKLVLPQSGSENLWSDKIPCSNH